MAIPLHANTLARHALEISGRKPGKHWARRFIRRHPCLASKKPRGLDPKHARNFNKDTVKSYFELRRVLEERKGPIPPQHSWNMDETGIQMGGGGGDSGMKYIYWAEDKDYRRLHSDNLELVSVIECVNAAGVVIPPAFILKDGPLAVHSDVEGIGA